MRFAIYQGGTDVGQCTWYAAGRRPDLDGITRGNAGAWLAEARGHKPEGTTPVVGAIAVNTTADQGVGHVAYVAGVIDGGATLILDEANVLNNGGVWLNVRTPASPWTQAAGSQKCGCARYGVFYLRSYVRIRAMGRAKNSSQGVIATPRGGAHIASNPAPRLWKPSSLQREYRAVLNMAKEDPQVILDTDDELLVIDRKDRADFRSELERRMKELARFQAALAANRDREPREWAAQTDFPYVAAFDRDDVDEFAQEFLAYTLDAAQRGTLENLEGNLRAWESSASIYEDPEMLAAMTADIDLGQLVEVFPPSEEQVRAAEG